MTRDLDLYYSLRRTSGGISIYTPNPDADTLTVGDLRAMLAGVPDDTPIITGKSMDDCNEMIQTVVVGKYTVGLFTEKED